MYVVLGTEKEISDDFQKGNKTEGFWETDKRIRDKFAFERKLLLVAL